MNVLNTCLSEAISCDVGFAKLIQASAINTSINSVFFTNEILKQLIKDNKELVKNSREFHLSIIKKQREQEII